ncbi:Gfo/Idh/MocA family protein [Gracilibacillus phocaeensis]|uniref:Gfo/Idh/MocA family protein n=1 Tax=Gracilibacillus phocaeensis TaxID=2042304 RepID=UPI00103030C5|nr:Gfo/Idh/MocA family oxidoreductase [Gracilibacillus phocaeensis]
MKVGMISFAHIHATAYAQYLCQHPDVEIIGIWDDNVKRGREMAEFYQTRFCNDLSQLLATEVEAVIICSENVKHKEHVIAAAQAKKHILCEKPIATSLDDARAMIDVCNQEQVTLQIAYPVRFSPVMQQVKKIIEAKDIGDVVAINGTNHGQMPGSWFVDKTLSGGGAATDHIVHLLDVTRWLLNDEAKSIYAELDTKFHPIDVEDCGIVSLEMESGVIFTIDPSWSRPKVFPTWGDVTMEIVGTEGSLSIDAFKQHFLLYSDRKNTVQQLPWLEDMDQVLINDFVQCIQQKREPSITGEDGLRALEVVKAAYQSAEINQVVPIEKVEV